MIVLPDNAFLYDLSRWSGKQEPWMIKKHGGLEDFVVDPFGFKYQVDHDHNHDHNGYGDVKEEYEYITSKPSVIFNRMSTHNKV